MRLLLFAGLMSLAACSSTGVALDSALGVNIPPRERAVINLLDLTEEDRISPFNRASAQCIVDGATEAEILEMSQTFSKGKMLRVIEPIRRRDPVARCMVALIKNPITLEPI